MVLASTWIATLASQVSRGPSVRVRVRAYLPGVVPLLCIHFTLRPYKCAFAQMHGLSRASVRHSMAPCLAVSADLTFACECLMLS